jgi:hypothetical protein
VRLARDTSRQVDVREAGGEWADAVGWELVGTATEGGRTVARFEGPLPTPDTDGLRSALREHGVDPGDVRVELLPRSTIDL